MTLPEAPRPHRSPADRMASIVASVLAVLAGMASLFFSPFFVMATDSCGHENCRDSLVTWAYVVTWGGIALAAIVGVVGVVTAARRGSLMWVWPALALLLVVVTFAIGAQLASSAAPGV
ncbi:MAG: hypothetical protein ACR2JM_14815 [Mycobacterium sp.]